MTEAGLVSAIVVNYKTERYLPECLHSIRQQDYSHLELILINNASPDFNHGILENNAPQVFIDNPRNLGFARANNQGILRAQGEFVLLLNADARVPPGFVARAVKEFERSNSIGTVVPRIVKWDDPATVESTGHLLRTDFTAAHRDHGVSRELACTEPGYVFGGSAACVVYRREMLEAVRFGDEFFDEAFFAYFEDVDLDLRAQLVGYKAWYSPDLEAEHVGHGSGQRNKASLRLVAEKNRYLTLLKCLTVADWLPLLPSLAAYEVYHFLRTLLQPYLFLAFFSYLYHLPRALLKRWDILRKRRLRPAELRALQVARFSRQQPATPRHTVYQPDYPLTASVIILNHNGLADTRQCLDALKHQSFADLETIVVDNGSDNHEGARLQAEYPEARILLAGVNLGFAGGVNLGYTTARGKYVILLNNDAIPEPQFVEKLVASMEETEADAGCGVLIEEGRDPTNDSLSILGRSIPNVFGNETLTFYPSGAAAILRTASIEAMGGSPFDPQYFIYHEDVSLGLRMRLAGGDVIKIPRAQAQHRGGATARKLPLADVRYFQTRNRILNRLVYFEAATLARILPLTLAESICRHLRALISWTALLVTLRVDGFVLPSLFRIVGQRRRQGRLRRLRPLAKSAAPPTRDCEFLPLLSGKVDGKGGLADRLSLGWLRFVRLPIRENRTHKL
ncbi:MAG: hypothetical protein A2Y63_03710 [Candidatus Riflebacteria bacterium RBG_13_59_9]|nr:MAG: hypothetical protein A2Y63_03710 [Candidatus Riflebacteria bacterium RBG_13_59_9]